MIKNFPCQYLHCAGRGRFRHALPKKGRACKRAWSGSWIRSNQSRNTLEILLSDMINMLSVSHLSVLCSYIYDMYVNVINIALMFVS